MPPPPQAQAVNYKAHPVKGFLTCLSGEKTEGAMQCTLKRLSVYLHTQIRGRGIKKNIRLNSKAAEKNFSVRVTEKR